MSTSVKCLVLVLMGSMLLGGCAAGMGMAERPAPGFMYSNVKSTSMLTDNPVSADAKTGTGEVTSYLGLVALGDVSVGSAMKKAGITKVQRVDYEFYNILGLYATVKVTVVGD